MKNYFFLLIALVVIGLSVTSCDDDSINEPPSSNITTEDRYFTDYSAITVSGVFQVFVNFSETEESIQVEANENLHQYVIVEKIGDNLIIRFQNNISIEGDPTLNIYITTSGSITDYEASGASSITLDTPLAAGDVDIVLSGSARFEGTVAAISVDADISGSSIVDWNGMANNLDIVSSGSAILQGYDFVTDELDLSMSGTSVLSVTVNTNIEVTGSGEAILQYKGTANIGEQNLSAGAQVIDMN